MTLCFFVSDEQKRRSLMDSLASTYTLAEDRPESLSPMYFDTFDWRLFKAGITLFRHKSKLFLKSPDGRIHSSVLSSSFKPPFFCDDLPESPIHDLLKNACDVRALLPVARIRQDVVPFRILNEDNKTVCHLSLIKIRNTLKRGDVKCYAVAEALRGYSRPFAKLSAFLKNSGLTEDNRNVLEIALENAERRPGEYSSKIDVKLDPGRPLHSSALSIFRLLQTVMTANEEGILKDIDTEFLHDFRVAVRRTRAAMTQITGIFPPGETDVWKEKFRRLGRASNRLRDLDVYLQKKNSYRELLPEHFQGGLEGMFSSLQAERRREFRKFRRLLESDFYGSLKTDWDAFLDKQEQILLDPQRRQTDTLPSARAFIKRRLNRVLKIGARLNAASPDEDFHALRLGCKKLRYLLEFFSSLFPDREMTRLIGQLKLLQDHLGQFNDLRVQQNDLEQILAGLSKKPSSQETVWTAAAVGGLIIGLDIQKQKARSSCTQIFRTFAGAENRCLFDSVLKAEGGNP